MKKTKVKKNKPIYLGLSILEISKIMYKFWYDYMKPKYGQMVKIWSICQTVLHGHG